MIYSIGHTVTRPSQVALAALMTTLPVAAQQAAVADMTVRNPLQELFEAQRLVADQQRRTNTQAAFNRRYHGGADLAANRLREKRRQKAKQTARRLKASRS